MALATTAQDDFSGGVYRGRKAPGNAVYDAVNCLVNDEGLLCRRGGSEYLTTSDTDVDLSRVVAATLPGPAATRVVAWGTKIFAVNGTAPVEITDAVDRVYGRPVSVSGVLVWPTRKVTALGQTWNEILTYGGSLLPYAQVTGGTVTVTHDSTAMTKSGGASWVGAVDPGMIVSIGGGAYALVRTVDGADKITLVYPYSGATLSTASYEIDSFQPRVVGDALPTGIPASERIYLGTAGQRLLVGVGNRVYVAARSTAGPTFSFDPDLYHEISSASEILGIEGVGDSAAVFTTAGVHAIRNLSLDLVDAFGNIQQSVERISGEIILWGENGITSWAGGIVVPALDDIHVMSLDGSSVPLTGNSDNERVRRRYRAYTAVDGYQPGTAAVYRGHLFMPIVDGATVIDVLVCRLDRGTAWTSWAGHAAGAAFAATYGAKPALFAVRGRRVLDLTAAVDPASSGTTDADGTTSDCVITTRDFPAGDGQPGFVQRARVRYELAADSPFDNFERADENPLAGRWSPWLLDPLILHDGAATANGTTDGLADARLTGTFPAGTIEIITRSPITLGQSESFTVGVRINAGDPTIGYTFSIADTGLEYQIRLYSGISGIGDLLDLTILPYTSSINGLRLTATGSTITGHVRLNGTWTQIANVSDTTSLADGTVGFQVSGGNPVESVRWGVDPASVALAFSSDQDAGAFTTLTDRGEQGGAPGWGVSAGDRYQWACVGKRRERIRFRVTVSGACVSFVMRSIELLLRPTGKQ